MSAAEPVDEALQEREAEEIRRAKEAKLLLEHTLLVEAFEYLEKSWRHALMSAPIDKPELLQAARLRLDILSTVKRELQHVVTSGTLAATARDERDELAAWIEKDHRENG